MGLLDDAIREHLELKRLKGANPGEVARDERDVLGQMVEVATGDEGVAEPADQSESAGDLGRSAASGENPTEPERQSASSLAGPGQETVELDMGSVLEGAHDCGPAETHDVAEKAPPTPIGRPRDAPATGDAPAADDSPEWEMPSDQAADGEGEQEPVEDVLEETPEFLRETPEQERLWFEQRPPRDFDFNE